MYPLPLHDWSSLREHTPFPCTIGPCYGNIPSFLARLVLATGLSVPRSRAVPQGTQLLSVDSQTTRRARDPGTFLPFPLALHTRGLHAAAWRPCPVTLSFPVGSPPERL
eukprot:5223555-Pyramimonas_sp.AAC.1